MDASTDSSNSGRFSLVFENVTLSQDDFENSRVSAYPNPSKGLVTIQSEFPVEGIEAFDLQGRSVLKVSGSSQIDLNSFMSGVYLLHIYTRKGKTIKKIIKD